MTARELIEKLRSLDPETKVVLLNENDPVFAWEMREQIAADMVQGEKVAILERGSESVELDCEEERP